MINQHYAYVFASVLFSLLMSVDSVSGSEVLWNFTGADNTDSFYEVSDTVRDVGMSKGAISMIESDTVRRAVLFTLLNPQENSACFAGVKSAYNPNVNWSSFSTIALNIRGQGMYHNFKVVLQDESSVTNSSLSFEQYFIADFDDGAFGVVDLPMTSFQCTYRGNKCSDTLNSEKITSFGLQAAGGVYEDLFSNRGVASLEIQYIGLSV
jgi:hypothetical protein